MTVGEVPVPRGAVTPEEIRGERLRLLGVNSKTPFQFRGLEYRNTRICVERFEKSLVTRGLRPGDVYSVGFSVRRSGSGDLFIVPRFRAEGENVASPSCLPAISAGGLRGGDGWQACEVAVRVPEGADELCLQITFEIAGDATQIELGDFKVYGIGDVVRRRGD